MTSSLEQFCQRIPKCELHAHLNGSLSTKTMKNLLKHHQDKYPGEIPHEKLNDFIEKNQQMEGLDFGIFDVVRSITDNATAVRMATYDVIQEFEQDGVRYLELRSTPRGVEGRMTKSEYCDSVIDGILDAQKDGFEIIVRFLISIDRRKLEDFDENVGLFLKLRKRYPEIMAGLDISGDPRVNSITELLPKLGELREQGVKCSIHSAEILNESETIDVLRYKPDRIGHCTFIHPETGGTQHQLDELLRTQTPVECCLTSNVLCKTSPSYAKHHANYLHNDGICIMLCTDDKGVFKCSLSGEYELAMKHFGWDKDFMFNLSFSSIDHIFATDEIKLKLKEEWEQWKMNNQHLFEC